MANPFNVIVDHLVTTSTASYVLDCVEEACVERAQLARKAGDEETARMWDRKGWAVAVAKSEVANEENYRFFCNNEDGPA